MTLPPANKIISAGTSLKCDCAFGGRVDTITEIKLEPQCGKDGQGAEGGEGSLFPFPSLLTNI